MVSTKFLLTGVIQDDTKVSEVIEFLQDYITLYGDQRINVEHVDDHMIDVKFTPYKNELLVIVGEGEEEGPNW